MSDVVPLRRKRRSEKADDELLIEVRDRFQQALDWEGEFRTLFTDDVRFCNGDSDNGWQWPDSLMADRGARPSLTVNKTRQHCLMVVNDAKQNKPEVRITAVSDQATKEAAEVFEGVVRHIEYISDAQTVYDMASEHQVQGGIGWWRLITDYEGPDSFDQEIRLVGIRDALSVYMDPDIQRRDGSDARFAFVVDDVPRDQFEAKYPEYKDRVPQIGFGIVDGGWADDEHIRVAEYYRRSEEADTLHLLPDGSSLRESEVEDDAMREQLRQASVKSREITSEKVEWFKVVGSEVVERKDWPGKYIPLIRVVGEECIIEGKLERKGHARALKDPQRIYNYWTSSAVESVALQSRVPYVAAAESIEAFQHLWDKANTENYAVLPWNARDDQGQTLPAPVRQEPPQMGQAYLQGLQIAQQEMMMVSGQYAPQMGQPTGPDKDASGKAIALRQRAGDNATYHYVDNLAIAIRFTGRQLIDLIPKVYDTPRVLRILQADGTVDKVQLDPSAPQALQSVPSGTLGAVPQGQPPGPPGMPLGPPNPMQGPVGPGVPPGVVPPGMPPGPPPDPLDTQAAAVLRIFNPRVGRYEVQADVGPSYATKRQEAFNAFTQIMTASPQLMQIAGDLMFRAADFPMAEDFAERLGRMVPPQALGKGPPPEVMAMQQQLQGAQAHTALLSEKLAVAELKLKAKEEQKQVNIYDAQTKRIGTLLNAADTDSAYVSGMELRALVTQLVRDTIQSGGLADVAAVSGAGMAQTAGIGGPPPGMPPPGGPPPPGAPPMHPNAPPGTPPGVHPGIFNGMHQALSPVRPPGINPPPGPPPGMMR
jgi:hypothetical protein